MLLRSITVVVFLLARALESTQLRIQWMELKGPEREADGFGSHPLSCQLGTVIKRVGRDCDSSWFDAPVKNKLNFASIFSLCPNGIERRHTNNCFGVSGCVRIIKSGTSLLLVRTVLKLEFRVS
jgi:hypothetical protein